VDIATNEREFEEHLRRSPLFYSLAIVCYMLTGDEKITTRAMAAESGVRILQLETQVTPLAFIAQVASRLS
jgi:high-affinity K+ transport system ATPase subunit B